MTSPIKPIAPTALTSEKKGKEKKLSTIAPRHLDSPCPCGEEIKKSSEHIVDEYA